MSFRTLTLWVLCVLAMPAVATADDFPTDRPFSTPTTAASFEVATKFWHANPCPAGVTFYVGALQSTTSSAGTAPIERFSPLQPCQIVLAAAIALEFNPRHPDYQDAIAECGAIVHYVGHALGFEHDDDWRSIMFGGRLTATVMGCYRAFKPSCVSRRKDRAVNERVWARYPA